jgi:hypoxanthine phosphoribosyltransferase
MKKNIILLLISIIHFCFINGLEKIFFNTYLKDNKLLQRPTNLVNRDIPVKFLGMPSGHVEITTIIVCSLYKYINVLDSIIVIIFMCLQRILSKQHTSIQTIIGFIFGFIYSLIYSELSYNSLLISCTLIFIYVNVILYKIDSLLNQKIPDWVDRNMTVNIKNKINTPYYLKFISILTPSFQQDRFLYMNWNDCEYYLDKIIKNIKNTNIKYDAIVGIKTGGAIISDYISKKLNIKNYKIKVSYKKYKCNKTANNFIDYYYESYIQNKDNEFIICEEIKDDINKQNIILIDESVSSGRTMNTCIDYLLRSKNVNIIYPTTIISVKNVKLINNYKLNTIIESYNFNTVFPWGYDN